MAASSDSVAAGFDIERARDDLARWLVEQKVVSAAEALPSESREADDVVWILARNAALVHMGMHGVPGKMRDADGKWKPMPRCHDKPCRTAGVSFALFELCSYRDDKDALALATEMESLADSLNKLDQDSIAAMAARATKLLAVAERYQAAGTEALVWRTTESMLRQLNAMPAVAQSIASKILSSRTGRMPREEGSGRPSQPLLTAVWKHLRSGGFSFDEIFTLVPELGDNAASLSRRATTERIRQRLRRTDPRGVRPWELDDETEA